MTAAAPDALNSSGEFSSIALDSVGNPVISHFDAGTGDLVLTHCDDPACAPGGDVTNTVDPSVNTVGLYTSLVLDGSDNPVISYYDLDSGDLKVAHCNDVDCDPAVAEAINTVDSAGDVGMYSSLALDGSGNPVISYYDLDLGDLKVAHCTVDDCSAATVNAVDSAGNTGLFTSIAMFGGLPTVSYYDLDNESVRLKRCANLTCTPDGVGNSVANTAGIADQWLSLVLDASGFPVISYLDEFGFVTVARCDDVACVGDGPGTQLTYFASGSPDPAYTSIALDGDIPVVSFYGFSDNTLRVGRCLDADCATSVVSVADNFVGGFGSSGAFSSLVLTSGGNPIISSYDDSNLDLVVTHCVDPTCNPRRIRSING